MGSCRYFLKGLYFNCVLAKDLQMLGRQTMSFTNLYMKVKFYRITALKSALTKFDLDKYNNWILQSKI